MNTVDIRNPSIFFIIILLLFFQCNRGENINCIDRSNKILGLSLDMKKNHEDLVFLIENSKNNKDSFNFYSNVYEIILHIHNHSDSIIALSGGISKDFTIINGCSKIGKEPYLKYSRFLSTLHDHWAEFNETSNTVFPRKIQSINYLLNNQFYVDDPYFNEEYFRYARINDYVLDLYMIEYFLINIVLPHRTE